MKTLAPSPPVRDLFLGSCPPAIIGAVPDVVVDAFDGRARRSLTHVREEVAEVIPPLTDCYASRPVVLPMSAGRLSAAAAHRRPAYVGRRAQCGMTSLGGSSVPVPPKTLVVHLAPAQTLGLAIAAVFLTCGANIARLLRWGAFTVHLARALTQEITMKTPAALRASIAKSLCADGLLSPALAFAQPKQCALPFAPSKTEYAPSPKMQSSEVESSIHATRILTQAGTAPVVPGAQGDSVGAM